MHKLFIVFGGLLLSLPGWSQQLEQSFLHQADSLYKQKEYTKAAHFYAQYTQVAEYTGILKLAYHNAACSYALAHDKVNAFKYLQLAVHNGWTNKEQT